MALFRGIQEYIALDANNITLVFDSGNIVNISGNIFLYPPQGHPILYKYERFWVNSSIDMIVIDEEVSYFVSFTVRATSHYTILSLRQWPPTTPSPTGRRVV